MQARTSSTNKTNDLASMENKNNGVKVTYIETQFVTSDAAGFKDLVQRLTGRSAPPPPPVPRRPLPCRPDGRRGTTTSAGAAGPPQGYHYPVSSTTEVRPALTISSSTPTTYLEGMDLHDVIDMADFSDLFYAGASASQRSDACYGGFPYY